MGHLGSQEGLKPKPNVRGYVHLAGQSERVWARQWLDADGRRRVQSTKLYDGNVESFPSECGVLVLVSHVTLASDEVTCPRCQELLAKEVEKALLAQPR